MSEFIDPSKYLEQFANSLNKSKSQILNNFPKVEFATVGEPRYQSQSLPLPSNNSENDNLISKARITRATICDFVEALNAEKNEILRQTAIKILEGRE